MFCAQCVGCVVDVYTHYACMCVQLVLLKLKMRRALLSRFIFLSQLCIINIQWLQTFKCPNVSQAKRIRVRKTAEARVYNSQRAAFFFLLVNGSTFTLWAFTADSFIAVPNTSNRIEKRKKKRKKKTFS